MSNQIQTITLVVGFDVDQTAVKLTWDTSPDSTPLTGVSAGALLLPKGAQLKLKVKGVGDVRKSAANAHPMSAFTVKECGFVTQPMIAQYGQAAVKTRFSKPSPFLHSATACTTLAAGYSAASVSDGSVLTIIDSWDSHLAIGQEAGRWSTYFFATVEIKREGESAPELRVFNFDCEIEVGEPR
ncbi:hypothetical protein AAKU55_000306 [Oxalobacteraceae bacterium GrIS 1.11]